jgi:hypothetical protein
VFNSYDCFKVCPSSVLEISVLIVSSYLDRNALANARVQGIEKSLGLKGDQFNTAISVLFAGYIALQVPSNAILVRTRPSAYLVRGSSSTSELCLITVLANVHGHLGSCLWLDCSSTELHRLGASSLFSWICRSVRQAN